MQDQTLRKTYTTDGCRRRMSSGTRQKARSQWLNWSSSAIRCLCTNSQSIAWQHSLQILLTSGISPTRVKNGGERLGPHWLKPLRSQWGAFCTIVRRSMSVAFSFFWKLSLRPSALVVVYVVALVWNCLVVDFQAANGVTALEQCRA